MTKSGTKLFKMYTQIVSTSFLSVQFLIHIPLQRYKFSSQMFLVSQTLKQDTIHCTIHSKEYLATRKELKHRS